MIKAAQGKARCVSIVVREKPMSLADSFNSFLLAERLLFSHLEYLVFISMAITSSVRVTYFGVRLLN